MTNKNTNQNTYQNNSETSTWVVGSIGLLLVLLAGILGFYNYWRMKEVSPVDPVALVVATPATGAMTLHTPLPLANSLDSTAVNTPPAEQVVVVESDEEFAEESAVASQNLVPVSSALFTGEFQAGQIVEAIGEEDGGVLFCADASAHSVIMNEYQPGDHFTIVPASGEYDVSPVENDGMIWYRLVAPDGLVGWMSADTFQIVEDELQQEDVPVPASTPAR